MVKYQCEVCGKSFVLPHDAIMHECECEKTKKPFSSGDSRSKKEGMGTARSGESPDTS